VLGELAVLDTDDVGGDRGGQSPMGLCLLVASSVVMSTGMKSQCSAKI